MLEVRDKYHGYVLETLHLASTEQTHSILDDLQKGQSETSSLPPYERAAILNRLINLIERNRTTLLQTLIAETGKPRQDADGEISRMILTLSLSAQLATNLHSQGYQLGQDAASTRYQVLSERVPAGVLYLITPFNFPLNLLAHKVGPAMASGCSFAIKPSLKAPLCALQIEELVHEAGWPKRGCKTLIAKDQQASIPLRSPVVRVISFTGSQQAGYKIQALSEGKRVTLELGSNSAALLCPDWPLDDAIPRIVRGAFYQSGQSCVSLQRLYVKQCIFDKVVDGLTATTQKWIAGDPQDDQTNIGPMIDSESRDRVKNWLDSAREQGSRFHLQGILQEGNILTPSILSNVPKQHPLMQQEAFGPVLCLVPFEDPMTLLTELRDSRSGLQFGMFTQQYPILQAAFETIPTGAVIAGDVPSTRLDALPYGGVGPSGIGKEGPIKAMEDFTEEKLMILRKMPISEV